MTKASTLITKIKTCMLQIIEQPFGNTADGRPVELYTLLNGYNMEVEITNYGGIITAIKVPGKNGKAENVVLGFKSLDGYLGKHPKIGATVGRYANRIAQGKFQLEGKAYNLAQNKGKHHIHGGTEGFDRKVWKVRTGISEDKAILQMSYTSPNGEEGYPGNLEVKVTYYLTLDGSLGIQYEASTDQPTVVNFTNHSYFNLNLAHRADIKNHQLAIKADRYLPANDESIPTGELKPVDNTSFDLRTPQSIQSIFDQKHPEIEKTKGLDHCFVLKDINAPEVKLAATLTDPESKRVLEVFTSEPGIQVYTGNFLDPALGFAPHQAVCLETQHFPDSPNKPQFPPTTLLPDQKFVSTTLYKFSVEDE
ncbi:aldose 1-epimerase [Microscilla marina ATCC 23134]|uniref:Aldose 1-epimerase n=2 Tax=Microscilla marina TaxID=1027 RepID=A1ZJ84_MICM2|nr:aldose 1-epimerase [Microscilla marina ATCC 23134]